MNQRLLLGTRTSALALWQTEFLRARLLASWPGLETELRPFITRGDKTLDQPLPQIGGKGLFTQELELALRQGEIDLAVHSLKDLPVEQPAGLTLGAILGRAEVRDVLISRKAWTLDTLPSGAIIGTSSLRRQAQLLNRRPDLIVRSIRGNVDTRVRKALANQDSPAGDYDAVVLAGAGVMRLGLEPPTCHWLPLETMLPAPGQGALAVQCRADDAETLRLLAALDEADLRLCVSAEREFLHLLGGGCSTPVAAFARYQDSQILLDTLVAAADGSRCIRVSLQGADWQQLAADAVVLALAQGAAEVLAHV